MDILLVSMLGGKLSIFLFKGGDLIDNATLTTACGIVGGSGGSPVMKEPRSCIDCITWRYVVGISLIIVNWSLVIVLPVAILQRA